MKKYLILLALVLLPVVSAVPSVLNIYGTTSNGSVLINGTINVTLSIYNTTNTSFIAAFNQSSATQFNNGYFSNYFYGLDPFWFFRNNASYLGVRISPDNESTPRINISSVPYSFVSEYVVNELQANVINATLQGFLGTTCSGVNLVSGFTVFGVPTCATPLTNFQSSVTANITAIRVSEAGNVSIIDAHLNLTSYGNVYLNGGLVASNASFTNVTVPQSQFECFNGTGQCQNGAYITFNGTCLVMAGSTTIGSLC